MKLRLSSSPYIFTTTIILSLFLLTSGQQSTTKLTNASGDNGPAIKARINEPAGLAVDDEGNLFIVERGENRVRRVSAGTGIITTVAGNGRKEYSGDGGPAIEAGLDYPLSVVVDKFGDLLISENGGHIRKVDTQTGLITTIAGNGGSCPHNGTGDRGPALDACIDSPDGLALDNDGNLFLTGNDHRIRRIDSQTGIITTVAGGGKTLGDGGVATSACLTFPDGIVFDRSGNMFIADYQNHLIRRVDAQTQIITTVAKMKYPRNIAIDEEGNLYVIDGFNDRVRRIDAKTGVITTVAGNEKRGFSGDGGPATKASLGNPSGVAVDNNGNLFITEFVNNRIRRVNLKTGIITTVAGNGLPKRD